MSQALRHKYEDIEIAKGQGKISAVITLSLGLLTVLSALCFASPHLFTTPELRAFYHPQTLRILLVSAIACGFSFGVLALLRHRQPGYGLTGMALHLGAALIAAGHLNIGDPTSPPLYFGLDYFVLTLVVLGLLFIPLERAFAKDPQPLLRRGWITDLKYFMLSHVGVQLISFFTVLPVQVLLHDATTWSLQLWVAKQPLWLQFIELLVIVDLGSYWVHRAFHEIPALWKIHAVHHSSEQMNWLASSRLHIIEIIANRLVGYLPIFVLGFDPNAVYAYLLFISIHAIFIHANVRFRFPGVRWLVATPEFHHWHHSSEKPAIDKNYAAFLPIYDVLFGTLYMPNKLASRYGTVGTPLPDGIVGQFLYPFRCWANKRAKSKAAAAQ